MNKEQKESRWLSTAVIAGAFVALWWLERRRPLRAASEPKLKHEARNLVVAGAGALALRLIEKPIAGPLAALVERRRWGLLKCWPLPNCLEAALAVVLMDYTLYIWHVLTHRVSWLWRFHVVHHIDLDLDTSTALRFHFGELTISVAWRAGQILLIGVSPRALSLWQSLLFLSILFHHSNVELPIKVERILNRLLVTPRMHGIHHSIIRTETDSNWSSGLTVWDWLHGTLQLNVPQAEIDIGVPAYRSPEDVTLPQSLALPFVPQRPSWQLLDGRRPARAALPLAPDHLLA